MQRISPLPDDKIFSIIEMENIMHDITPEYDFYLFFILCYTATLFIGMKKNKNIIWYIFVLLFASLPLYWPIVTAVLSYITSHYALMIFWQTHILVYVGTAVAFSFVHIFFIRCMFHFFHQVQPKTLKHVIYISFPICHLIYCLCNIKIIISLFLIVSNFLLPFFPIFNIKWVLIPPALWR